MASDADANNLENQHRVLLDCEQVLEDVDGGVPWLGFTQKLGKVSSAGAAELSLYSTLTLS